MVSSELQYDWHMTTLTPWPLKLWLGLILLAIGLFAWLAWRDRGSRLGGSILWLRALLLGSTLLLAMQPAIVWEQGKPIPPRVAILVDTSASMALPSQDAQQRLASVRPLLRRWQQHANEPSSLADLHWFDLQGATSIANLEAAPTGTSSDLLAGLRNIGQIHQNKAFSAIVIVSDGADTTLPLEQPPEQLSSYQQQLLQTAFGMTPPPVSSLSLGQDHTVQDIGIVQVEHDDFAFVRNTITIAITIRAQGFQGESVAVQLLEQDALLQQEQLSLQEGDNRVVLHLRPEVVGEHLYRITVPILPGEAITQNNSITFPLQVIRDKIRILHVVGRPSWDERFLRQHLKENPNIDVVSFFILRTPSDDTSVPEQDLSLIPFPVERLFTTELRNFDLILLQNFDHRPYRMTQYLPSIQQAVEQGLGMIMLGGNESFGLGGYSNSPIADILPFVPTSQDVFVQQPLITCLSETGRAHPITDLLWGRGDNRANWANLPPFTSFNRITQVHPSANVLVTDCSKQAYPILAVRDVGKGRVLALATDSLWRWRFSDRMEATLSEQAYQRFWSNSFRWLIKDPANARIKLQPERRQVPFGEPLRLQARMLNQQDMPLAGAQLRISIQDPNQQTAQTTIDCNEQGIANLTVQAPLLGTYTIIAEHPGSQESTQTSCVVQTDPLEYQHIVANPRWLEAIAKQTGGKVWQQWSDSLQLDQFPHSPQPAMQVEQTTLEPLWDAPWVWLMWLTLAVSEWWLRRRWGGI